MAKKEAPPPVVTLALAFGVADADLLAAVEQVATLREATAAFEPVLVTDNPRLQPLGRFGFPVEYVMPYDDWAQGQDPARWASYVEERLNYLVKAYRPGNVLVLGNPLGAGDFDRNLYGLLLRLTPDGVAGADGDDEVLDELGLLSLNVARIEQKIDRLGQGRDLGANVRGALGNLNARFKK